MFLEEVKCMKYIVLIPCFEPDNRLLELLKTIDNADIIVVDDGSGKKYKSIFDEASSYAHVISYKENMGKGYALKEGYKYIKNKYSEFIIVTMDCDGQHLYKDALKLIKYIEMHKDTLVIGKRKWDNKTPLKSRIGNYLTRKYYKRVTEINIYDTQSGLRAFSNELLDYMMNISGNRYEYEMNVLLELKNNNIKVHEIPINTIYIDNNSSSHFRFIEDSYDVYKAIKESKNKQKTLRNKINKIISIVFALIFCLTVIYYILFVSNKKINNTFRITYLDNCDYNLKPYLSIDNKKIYTYCIDKIEVLDNNKYIDLSEFVNKNNIDKLFESIDNNKKFNWKILTYRDGGSKEYIMSGLHIIKCNTIDGVKDIYFGIESMNFKSNFCKQDNRTFSRTYKINKISHLKQAYDKESIKHNTYSIKVNITDINGINEDVIIENYKYRLEENNLYTFEFQKNEDTLEDNIKSIFDNCKIVNIKKADTYINEEIY